MEQQWPVAAQGANMVAGKNSKIMAATMKATVNKDVEEKVDKDNPSRHTGKNQPATGAAKSQGSWRLVAGGWQRARQ
jgi:hypothetical protein